MEKAPTSGFEIRPVRPEEYDALGRLTVQCYEALPGMPGAAEQPEYYGMLFDVGGRVNRPTVEVFVAATAEGEILGGVTFIGDAAYYGSGGSAGENAGCSGIRLLAVRPEARRRGVGKALTRACIERAAELGVRQVILHSTKAMETAWKMYEGMGFYRSTDLDFRQGSLSVFGFRFDILPIDSLKQDS